MKDLQVIVFLTGSSERPVFERIISLSHGMVVSYSQLEDSLRFLFGLKCGFILYSDSMIDFVLTEVQYSILVKMLCTSTFSKNLDLQSSLINYVRDLNPALFDDSYPCLATM